MESIYRNWLSRVPREMICVEIARSGNLPLLQYAVEQGGRLRKGVYWVAARQNNVEMMNWLLDQDYPCHQKVWNIVTIKGYVDLFYLLFTKRGINRVNSTTLLRLAVKYHQWDILRAMFYLFRLLLCDVIEEASRCNNVPALNWMLTSSVYHFDPLQHEGAMCQRIAAQWGSLDVLNWLESQGVPLSPQLMNEGSWSKRIETVRWVYERTHILTENVWLHAIYFYQRPLLEWLLSIQPDYDVLRKLFKYPLPQEGLVLLEVLWKKYPALLKGYEMYVMSLLYSKKELGYSYRFLKVFPDIPNGTWLKEKIEDILLPLSEVVSPDIYELILQY